MLKASMDVLKKELMESASLVEGMIGKSIRGLKEKDEGLLLTVIEQDEPRENELEISIDEACINLVACYQPHAKDLRTIMMILKMNNDFERMADEAENICESALFLIKQPEVKRLIDIPRMGEEATKMIRDSLDSFINEDAQLARSVCERDDEVDDLNDQIFRELLTYMMQDPKTIEKAVELILVGRHLERIADHATNIGEDVIYFVKGKTIKHHCA